MRTPAIPRSTILNSGTNAAKPRGTSPPAIKNMPPIMASIAIIVTEKGRCLNESFSVLYHSLVNIYRYILVSLIIFVIPVG